MYFDGAQDDDAMIYLSMANNLIHQLKPGAITVAEEMSGMPGIACNSDSAGFGFDYRLAMGVPDFWIKIIKEKSDEEWDMDHLFFELTQHRPEERTISYCESHDQALVGDKTILFRLLDAEIYSGMGVESNNVVIERGVALHKMIRLLTALTAQSGYLNFMGNEFGHPEWIDFPRSGNNWSYKYARRQWSLADNEFLRYKYLYKFDREMISFLRDSKILQNDSIQKIGINNSDNVIAFKRSGYLCVFNFHPSNSYTEYSFYTKGKYSIVLNSDLPEFGGFDRIDNKMQYMSRPSTDKITVSSEYALKLYIPSRTAIILRETAPGKIR
jgi:1,4-alpha-glucan branching enzyme